MHASLRNKGKFLEVLVGERGGLPFRVTESSRRRLSSD